MHHKAKMMNHGLQILLQIKDKQEYIQEKEQVMMHIQYIIIEEHMVK